MAKLNQEVAKFKAELKKMSKNDLARTATEFYMNWVLVQHQLDELLKQQKAAEQKEVK